MLLRALHPIIPFVTEEIWHEVAPLLMRSSVTAKNKPAFMPVSSTTSISTQAYPRAGDLPVDDAAVAEIEWLKAVLTQVRRIRSEMNIAPGRTIPLLFAGGNASDRARSGKFSDQIAFLARTESQRWLESGETEPAAAAAIVGEMKLLIPLAGLIDIEAEKARLAREIKRIEGEIEKSNAKLARFGPNTPAAVVEQEKQRLAEFGTMLEGLRDQAERLAKI
jgi:valyl-tRNA synthetase